MKSEYEMRVTTQYSYNEGMEKGMEIGMERGRKEGRVEGRAEGRTEGRAEGRAETARAMLADGVDPAIVAKYSDLPPAYSAGSQEKK